MGQVGKRLIFNKENGKILNYCLEQMEGYVPNDIRPNYIDFIDIPVNYNENNFVNAIDYKIDINKDKKTTPLNELIIITKYITPREKSKDEQIQELENKLLLEKEKQLGGII